MAGRGYRRCGGEWARRPVFSRAVEDGEPCQGWKWLISLSSVYPETLFLWVILSEAKNLIASGSGVDSSLPSVTQNDSRGMVIAFPEAKPIEQAKRLNSELALRRVKGNVLSTYPPN